MKKIKYILLSIGLLLCTTVIVAERHKYIQSEHSLEEYSYTRSPHPSPHPPPKTSSAETAVDDVINIILAQGFSGAIILILFFWTYRTDKYNRTAQEENFNKFIQISQECSSNMGSVNTRLENIEREIEQSKQLEMLNASRKG